MRNLAELRRLQQPRPVAPLDETSRRDREALERTGAAAIVRAPYRDLGELEAIPQQRGALMVGAAAVLVQGHGPGLRSRTFLTAADLDALGLDAAAIAAEPDRVHAVAAAAVAAWDRTAADIVAAAHA
jgi:hypothetical protein